MTPSDMVYNSIYKGCKLAGCSELISKNAAQVTLQKYKNGQFKKVSDLIESSISEAKKLKSNKKK